jgi:hypothetical protein
VEKAQDICLALVEAGAGAVVLPVLSAGMNDKAAKVAVACGDCLTKALNSFGPKTVTIAVCQKNIAKAFDNSKPEVTIRC